MKIGTTGSLVNYVYSRSVVGEPRPVVGMGVTLLLWSDRHAGTITKVEELSSKAYSYVISVQADRAVVVKGSTYDGSAEYVYSPEPKAYTQLFRKSRETGLWRSVLKNPDTGRLLLFKGCGIRLGEREAFQDPSF